MLVVTKYKIGEGNEAKLTTVLLPGRECKFDLHADALHIDDSIVIVCKTEDRTSEKSAFSCSLTCQNILYMCAGNK